MEGVYVQFAAVFPLGRGRWVGGEVVVVCRFEG